jgi:alkylation response protein AidB-like acyl-CoA dehydrogenase
MSSTVSAEREAILQTVRDFAQAEIRPHVMEWDEAQQFPHEVFRKLGELGLLGTIFPEEYGGAGLSTCDYASIVEEIASVDGSVALALAAHTSLGSSHIFRFGTEAQRRRYTPKLAAGEWLAAWGLTEAEAGSDSGGTRTTAVRENGSWVLNGSKNFITNASVGKVAVLMAVTDPPGATADLRLHRRARSSGNPRREEGEQARHARLRHLHARDGGLPHPRGEPSRR